MAVEESKNIDFVLGQLSGKMDGIVASIASSNATVSTTFKDHASSDDRNFGELKHQIEQIRQQMAKDREETTADRIKIAQYVGGTVVIMSILSYVFPLILNKLFV